MKLADFISKLKLTHDVPNYYNNHFPKNCGYWDGSRYSWDCWNLIKTLLANPPWEDTRIPGSYVSPATFVTGDCDGYHLLMQCTNRSKDFSQLKQPGTYLYISDRGHEHAGVYVGDFEYQNAIFNVVECTSDWASKVQYTYVNEKGQRFLYKGGPQGRSWTDYGLLPWIEYDLGAGGLHQAATPEKAANPKTADQQTFFGIDVSRWQKGFNLQSAWNEGFTYCIIKAGGADSGYYRDPSYDNFYSQAVAGGWQVGAYYFGQAFSVEQAVLEANYFIQYLQGKKIQHVYYDVEGKMLNQGFTHLTDIIKAFCQTMTNAGYICGVYTSESQFNSRFDDKQLAEFPHWVARYSKTAPNLKSGCPLEIWQFGGSTNYFRSAKIAGTTVDQNLICIPWIAVAEPIVAEPQITTPSKKTVQQVAVEVLAGVWGNNPIRRIRLTAAGYNYTEVQQCVEEIIAQRKQTKKTHVVVRDENLSKIAKRYGTTVDAIVKANGIPNKNLIYVGQELIIP